MINLYYWPTPNGQKITMFCEETGLDYGVHPVDISAGAGALSYRIEPTTEMDEVAEVLPLALPGHNPGIAGYIGEVRAYAKGEPFSSRPTVTEEGKKLLFGQTAANVARV